jgi:hypothetical protein
VVVSSVPRRGRDGDGADRAGQRDEVMLPRSHVAMNMRLGTIPRRSRCLGRDWVSGASAGENYGSNRWPNRLELMARFPFSEEKGNPWPADTHN